jgi:L,D-transpeptidase catalytic domain
MLMVAVALLASATVAFGQSSSGPAVAPAPGAPASPTTPPNRAPADVVLSDEQTVTTWATAVYAQPVYQQPSKSSRVVTRLRFVTSDGFLQSYIALRERKTARGDWVQLRLPMRPNGRTGWVRRGALDTFSVVHTQLVLNRAQHRITLYRSGNVVFTAPVGVGKASTPTPPGHFWITEKFAVHGMSVYGPYAFGTSDYSVLSDWPGGGIIGLHGTDQPQLVPGNPSHGCIRLHNSDVMRLAGLVPIGTPLLIT